MANNNKPNLFSLATSELSQDAFITWLLKWADPQLKTTYTKLHLAGKRFLRSLIAKYDSEKAKNIELKKVVAGRQRDHIDVWVEVNNDIFIIIEDKTGTQEHSNQLKRYKNHAENYFDSNGKKWETILPVYLKTGNESLSTFYKEECYSYSRKDFLDVLDQNIENDIYKDFRDYLQHLEGLTQSYLKTPVKNWTQSDSEKPVEKEMSGYAVQGFYLDLQERLKTKATNQDGYTYPGWEYVPNISGGFQGFYWFWKKYDGGCSLYLQIEDAKKLVIKAEVDKETDNTALKIDRTKMYQIYEDISKLHNDSPENPISLSKAGRFGGGKWVSIANITQRKSESFLSLKDDGTVDMESTVEFLRTVENLICKVTQ